MATATLFWTLIAISTLSLIALSFISKISKVKKGGKLIIDGDSVIVADDEIQDLIFEVQEKAEEMAELQFHNSIGAESHAVA